MKRETIFKDGFCQYADGTPSYVRPFEYEDEIPEDFVEFHTKHDSDPVEAWKHTIEWRRNKGIWNILQNPSPNQKKMEAVNTILFHGHSRDGYPIVWEIGKGLKAEEFGKISNHDHLRRVHYLCEFGRNILCEGGHTVPEKRQSSSVDRCGMIFVMDFGGIDLTGYFSGGAFLLRCLSFKYLRRHYPQQLRHSFVINIPTLLLPATKPLLSRTMWGFKLPETCSSRSSLARLRTQIDDDQIPPEYGGSSPYKLGEHPYQLRMNAMVDQYLPEQAAEESVFEDNKSESNRASVGVVDDAHQRSNAAAVPEPSSSANHFLPRVISLFWSFILMFVTQIQNTVGVSPSTSSSQRRMATRKISYDRSTDSTPAAAATTVSSSASDGAGSEGVELEGTVIDIPTNHGEVKERRRKKFPARLRRSLKRFSMKRMRRRSRKVD